MVDHNRRLFMKGALGAGAAGLALGTGLIAIPTRSFAAAPATEDWPAEAYEAGEVDKTIQTLYGRQAEASDKITLNTPTIAQNGAVVPVTVEADLPNVTSIALLVAANPNSMAAEFEIPEGTLPYVSNRLKMAETTDVVAVVESDGKLYKTSKNVKVTVGGCGG